MRWGCWEPGLWGWLGRDLLRFVLFDVFLGGVGCWIAGIWGGGVCSVGVCFRFGKKLFGAAYHLHDECHIFNIFGVTVCSE